MATFGNFLTDVRATVLDAFAHDEVPFERLVHEVQARRDLSRNPLFDVMVLLEGGRRQPPQFAGLAVDEVRLPRRTANFDITIEFREYAGGLAGVLEYRTDLFEGYYDALLHRPADGLWLRGFSPAWTPGSIRDPARQSSR